MVDVDTFLTTLYVMADTFCKTLPPELQPGPDPSLTCSEVMTLALVGQWARFQSERDFYRYAERHLRSAFPTLPDRAQFNRLLRHYRGAITTFGGQLVELLQVRQHLYQALDCSGVPTRKAKRRGNGWLPGLADIGWSNRLGWSRRFSPAYGGHPRRCDHRLWLRRSQHERPAASGYVLRAPAYANVTHAKRRAVSSGSIRCGHRL